MRYRQASLVVAGLFALARHGAAVPSLSVRSSGSCPTQSELEAALVERRLELGNANHTVDVQSDATGATLRLQHSEQGQVLERHFASQDCRALAEAMAVVVEAYFIDMRGPDAEPGNTGGGQAGGAPTASALSPYPDNGAAPTPAQPDPMVTTPWRLAQPASLGQGSTSRSRQPVSFEGFVGFGPALTLPDAQLTPEIELGAGTDVPSLPVATELALATTLPTTSGSGLDRVWRWSSQGVFRVGVPLAGTYRYRPWLGLGLATARLRALDVPAAPTKTAVTSIAEAGVDIAWPLGTAWHGRFDVGCSILLFRDTYRVDPDGEIGRGPRVVCATLIGVGIGAMSVARELQR